jgi:peptide/nickel transport system substrate-binding protein
MQENKKKEFFGNMDRRQFLKNMGMAGGVVAAGSLVKHGLVSQAWAAEPKRGGIFVFASQNTPPQFDPAYFKDNEEYYVGAMVYNRLTFITPDLTVTPELAERWESNKKGNEWMFYLRKGVKFHNGKELEAKDVANSLNHFLEAGGPAQSELAPAERFEVADKYTVKAYLSSGFAEFPFILGKPTSFILPHDIPVEKWRTALIGTGPFKYNKLVPGEYFEAVRNPDYWDKERVFLDGVKMVIIPDSNTMVSALISGEIDLMPECESAQYLFLKDKKGIAARRVPSLSYQPLEIDTTVKPFDDVRVIRAIKACLNREQFVNAVLQGMGQPANDHPLPSFSKDLLDVSIKKQDYELAKRLLSQAGYPNGLDIVVHTSEIRPGMVPSALTLKDQCAPAGIKVEVKVDPADGYWKQVWKKVPACVSSWNGRPTTFGGLNSYFHSKGKFNTSKYFSPLIDTCLGDAVGEVDRIRAVKLYAAVQALVSENSGFIIPYLKDLTVAHSDKIHGWFPSPIKLMSFFGVWKA